MIVSGRVSRKFASSSVPVTPMTATVTFPTEGSSVTTGQAITVTANGTGPVSFMEFWADGVQLGTDSTVPYSFAWTPATDGAHTVAAVANDGAGTRVSSVNVNVTAAAAGSSFSLDAPAASKVAFPAWYDDYTTASPWQLEDNTGSNWLQIAQGNAQADQIVKDTPTNFGIPAPPGLTSSSPIMRWRVSQAQFDSWWNTTTHTYQNGGAGFVHAKCYKIWGTSAFGATSPTLTSAQTNGAYRCGYYIPNAGLTFATWDPNEVHFSNIFQWKSDNNRIITTVDLLALSNSGTRNGVWLFMRGWTGADPVTGAADYNNMSSSNPFTLRLDTGGLVDTWFSLKAVLNVAASTITYYYQRASDPNPVVICTLTSNMVQVKQPAEVSWTFGGGHYAGIGWLYTAPRSFVPNGT